MHSVRFRKVKNNHNRLRDDTIQGQCFNLPKVGKLFVMTAEPKTERAFLRRVNTSLVVKCTLKHNVYTLETQSGSIYKVEML